MTLHSEVISAMAHKRIRQNVNFALCGKKEILYHRNQYQLARLAKKKKGIVIVHYVAIRKAVTMSA